MSVGSESGSPDSPPADSTTAPYVERGDIGYRQSLSSLQMQMIAIGGAVGVGLFLGLGDQLHSVGPGLVLSYAVVGVLVYLLMRALGEMSVYRPTTGAFVSYAREFVGPRFAHLTGWLYVTVAILVGIAEISAVGVYTAYWFPNAPEWLSALVALCLVFGSNILTVRAFGLIESVAAAVKVIAIVLFLVTGLLVVFLGGPFGWETEASVTNLWSGGFLPHGILPAIVVMQVVVFSFSAVEVTATAAGEAKDAAVALPKAVRGVVLRLGLFYIGSVLVLAMLLPTERYSGGESPFVTALASLNVPYLGGIMNVVVLSASLSGVNAALYATVRLLRNLAAHGSAPKWTVRMSGQGVPVGALWFVGVLYLAGAVLILFADAGSIFSLALGSASVCILLSWISIFVSHLRFSAQVRSGAIAPVSFRMPGTPYTNWCCLALLGVLVVSLLFDFSGDTGFYSLVVTMSLVAVHLATYEFVKRRVAREGLPDVTPV
ncbi:amino acid permease [Saccharomonospora viridis]|jgi:L-asparagine permease|uniref:Gamma-aminobutyrate permease-like transporter n=3 Tax=Saccharomonospora viridis TaxID=1852 RepID=C7MVY8_SACVD|nr:amino acid permease [Saccharomonospora viridis]ACU97088.1 gamma-aminobutyrate permease-like transporter [Saccharomonospora viridis DSM 43017]KHF43326.1 asparagine permease [Saccharomonospora viridis]SFO80650.1 L-asparagine permease [Saccharomonospora viridis]